MARIINYPELSTISSEDWIPISDISTVGNPLRNVAVSALSTFFNENGVWTTVTGGINYAGGNVGIGTTTPLAKLQVFGGSAIIGGDDFNVVKISANVSGTTYNAIGNGFIAPNVNFDINNQTRLTIKGNTGNVGIGTTSPSHKLDVTGTGRFTSTLTCQTLVQTSQRNQKKDIGNINKTKAIAIPFKEYKYKSESGDRKRYGVVVEDIEAHYPELVHIDADGIKGVNYIDLLVKRVAELEKELEDISLTQGPKGDTGLTGATGVAGATGSAGLNGLNGLNGNSHLENVASITYNSKTKKLEILIVGHKSPFSFTPALTEFEPGDGLSPGLGK